MTRSDDERLGDIIGASREVAELVARGRDAYDSDRLLQLALERLCEIIGEASSGLSPVQRTGTPEIPWRDIVRLRNLVAHHYHRVDPDLLWTVACEDIPKLHTALEKSGGG